jgi:hypothetical protein
MASSSLNTAGKVGRVAITSGSRRAAVGRFRVGSAEQAAVVDRVFE